MKTKKDYTIQTEHLENCVVAYILPNELGNESLVQSQGDDEDDATDNLKECLREQGFIK